MASIDDAFPTWERFKLPLIRTIGPGNQTYRVRSRFLFTRQGKNELSDYVQELRTLIAAMQRDPLPEVVHVTMIMEGLCPGPDRPEVFCVHPTTLEGAVEIAHKADNNFKIAKLGGNGYNPSATRTSSMSTSA